MKRIFVFSLIAFLSFFFLGCQHPCSERESITAKRIIVFLDALKGNDKIFLDHFMPKIENLIKSNKSSMNLFSLEVYPITNKSSGEKALVDYTLTEDKSNKICRIQNQDIIQISEIKQQFYEHSEVFRTRDTSLSILYTIPLLSEKLSFSRDNEKIFVIYLSDMVELHNPANEDNGYYSFLQPGTNTIDNMSIEIAQDHLDSCLYKICEVLERCNKDSFDSCSITVFLPNSIQIEPDEFGNREFIIYDFWKELFSKIGTSIAINRLSDLDDDFDFDKK